MKLGPFEIRSWLAPAPPLRLGVSRALFCGLLFLYYLRVDFAAWAHVPRLFWRPMSFFAWLGIGFPSPGPLAAIEIAWKASLLLAAAGAFTRVTMPLAAVGSLYVLGLPNNYGKINHNAGLVAVALCVLALARSGDAFSVDAWLRKRRGLPEPAPSGEHTWPIKAVQLALALAMLGAGLSKLRTSGLSWASAETMQATLIHHHYRIGDSEPWTDLGVWIAARPWLCRAMAVTSLVCEVGLPLAVVSRAARWTLVPGIFLMQVGIRAFMGVDFTPFMTAYVFFVPWDRLLAPLTRRRDRARARPSGKEPRSSASPA